MRARVATFVSGFRRGPLDGAWLFAVVASAQLGHVIEHISVALRGSALLGPAFDTETSHFVFNTFIAVISVLLVLVYPRNVWAYVLCAVAIAHGVEHAFILHDFLQAGVVNSPGFLGHGGALGILPIARNDLHNLYNGTELVLMALGFTYEFDRFLDNREELLMPSLELEGRQ
jgi:hypothetical protein